MNTCNMHKDLQKSIEDIDKKLDDLFSLQIKESVVTVRNGTNVTVNRGELLVNMYETQKVILADIKSVKEDTALWRDTSKFVKYIGGFWKRHYIAIVITGIIALLLLDIINPIDLWVFILSGMKNYLNIH